MSDGTIERAIEHLAYAARAARLNNFLVAGSSLARARDVLDNEVGYRRTREWFDAQTLYKAVVHASYAAQEWATRDRNAEP